MKKEQVRGRTLCVRQGVLILVLMEWRKNILWCTLHPCLGVLILVLMEWRKNLLSEDTRSWGRLVLILVLMEWRKNLVFLEWCSVSRRFNPCSNGMKKEHWGYLQAVFHGWVLILVLMEWRKNFGSDESYAGDNPVLILVLMEWRKNPFSLPVGIREATF